ncbi:MULTISPECIES: nucleoside-diphosphate sugar epimerase/dehydratase [unclassified Mesotoga]|uniref:nucleoside-diphosphate sugar epimerase/dehydratase n=2 Tax=Mesotoga TaxID=1184396 RepID=UPI000EF1E2FA|nr:MULTISPECIES: nucleoside-diphosphate sugar epimerase/dehydratase [unclassified Mesotoga]MDI9368895.1 nucleoside-diphosphate sugar epimerase/dehydratase [Thermotogota bacterium]MDD3680602.1 nucleoside-diphosphate sugar epimerase/dehydratase [Mesotoga sp.]MDD4207301.1 nucleoside-diphosphate sugar epimerase/dehydratase [Mesotoga sp.]MDD4824992.1 nucleoside-diphosphate sugar epimerase/dehydratase [Mesotoga sp.]RLL83769.1 polysaccharide biosynthesis protein [Mesotoga sp. BH458_6_3_2_1]
MIKLGELSSFRRNLMLLILDSAIVYFAYILGMYFRYGIFTLDEPQFFGNGIYFSIFIVASLILNGVYRIAWSYSYFRDYFIILRAVAVGYAVGFAAGRLLNLFNVKFLTVPFTVSTMAAIISVFLIIWSRILWLSILSRNHQIVSSAERVFIVGAGDAGTSIAEELSRHPGHGFVVGFIDDSPRKLRKRIRGIPVLGNTSEIMNLVDKMGVGKVIIAIPSADAAALRRIFSRIDVEKVKVQTLPSITEIMDGKAKLGYLREINIEDLLGRESVQIDLGSLKDYIIGRNVLITGAGGSIGSELCRQIAPLEPRRLLLAGKGENSIYEIRQEIGTMFPDLNLCQLICDVADSSRMRYIFEAVKPEVVFHAAAHKHVPLMEENPTEAFRVNSLGTYNIAGLASEFGVETVVIISTDKAVKPSSVMGVSKRIAEEFVRSISSRSKTKFGIVRFGNVLGSRGSVIPLFKKQIQSGGPVTVTDPRMTRYFMTIPEAVSLVLQAGAYSGGGDVFVLDMGEPVKISSLANEMITLAGYVPQQEIEIKYTGVRPGEKLFEELVLSNEEFIQTKHPKIFRLKTKEAMDEKTLLTIASRLRAAVDNNDFDELNKITAEIVDDATVEISAGCDFR